MPIPRPCRTLPSRPGPSRPRRFPDPRQPTTRRLRAPAPNPVLDAIAAEITGRMVNAALVGIDELWSRGEPLDQPLATYSWLAHAASRRHTAGLWTLIAWIHWRSNDPAGRLASPAPRPGHRPRPGHPALPRRVHVRPRRPRPHPADPVPMTSDDYLIGAAATTGAYGPSAPAPGPDSAVVPCRVCGTPLSQPRVDYGRTTCRHHYRLEPKDSTP